MWLSEVRPQLGKIPGAEIGNTPPRAKDLDDPGIGDIVVMPRPRFQLARLHELLFCRQECLRKLLDG